MKNRIVIVSGIQLSNNPRVVKEADALGAAGFDVEVLAAVLARDSAQRERLLYEGKPWRFTPVIDNRQQGMKAKLGWTFKRLRTRFWREVYRYTGVTHVAQSHLATYKGRKVGTMGDAATFSFYPGKNLGAMGDAGGIVTNRDDIAEFSTLFARHGGKNNHVIEGINSRLDGLQAAILNVKLNHIENWTKLRQQHGAHYDQILAEIPGIALPKVRPECEHVYHLYVIKSENRDELRDHLKSNDIPTVVNYPMPLPLYKAYEHLGHKREEFSVAANHADQILSLAIYPEMPDQYRGNIAASIREFASASTQV